VVWSNYKMIMCLKVSMYFLVTSILLETTTLLNALYLGGFSMSKNFKVLNELTSHECGIEYTLTKIGGKWKPLILWFLIENGTKRYGEIRRYIPDVTNKMLSQQLKELAADKLIKRKDYKTVPPKVEYSITKEGLTLHPILELMCAWGYERN